MIHNSKLSQGITVIELLLVITITGVLAASFLPFGAGFLARNNLEDKTNEVVSLLRTAQINSLAGKENSAWGVHIGEGNIIMFKGSAYVSPGTSFDQKFEIPNNVSISSTDIVFNKLTGNPASVATIIVSNNLNKSYSVTVNQVGIVDVN